MQEIKQNNVNQNSAIRWQQRKLVASPWLHEEVARRMVEKLSIIKLEPQICYYWHALNSGLNVVDAVVKRYPSAQHFAIENTSTLIKNNQNLWLQNHDKFNAKIFDVFKKQSLKWLTIGQLESYKQKNHDMQLIWANMCLHGYSNIQELLQQWLKLLQPNGFLMFSCFGPDSLIELRNIYKKNLWDSPCQDFIDMHDLGDCLLQSGFIDPVMDMEKITLQYTTAQSLLKDLKQIGFNLSSERSTITKGRHWYQTLLTQIEQNLRNKNSGKLELTFEILYGHAIAAIPTAKVTSQSSIDLATMQQILKNSINK